MYIFIGDKIRVTPVGGGGGVCFCFSVRVDIAVSSNEKQKHDCENSTKKIWQTFQNCV